MELNRPSSFKETISNLFQIFSPSMLEDSKGQWNIELLAYALGIQKFTVSNPKQTVLVLDLDKIDHMPKYYDSLWRKKRDYYSFHFSKYTSPNKRIGFSAFVHSRSYENDQLEGEIISFSDLSEIKDLYWKEWEWEWEGNAGAERYPFGDGPHKKAYRGEISKLNTNIVSIVDHEGHVNYLRLEINYFDIVRLRNAII